METCIVCGGGDNLFTIAGAPYHITCRTTAVATATVPVPAAPAARLPVTDGYVFVRLSGAAFNRGLAAAKKAGGRYNPDNKLWAIPATRPELAAAAAYGWQVVGAGSATSTGNREICRGCGRRGDDGECGLGHY